MLTARTWPAGAGEQGPAGSFQDGPLWGGGEGADVAAGWRAQQLHPPGAALLRHRAQTPPRNCQQPGERNPAGKTRQGRRPQQDTSPLWNHLLPNGVDLTLTLTLPVPKHAQALQAYEAQVSSLVRGMSRLEEELHSAQEEKAALLSDVASVRELCVKLDSGKELTARQLTSRSMDLERVRQLWCCSGLFIGW